MNVLCLVGRWSEWGVWSECSVTCGGGRSARARSCEQQTCIGTTTQERACNTFVCEPTGKINPNFFIKLFKFRISVIFLQSRMVHGHPGATGQRVQLHVTKALNSGTETVKQILGNKTVRDLRRK